MLAAGLAPACRIWSSMSHSAPIRTLALLAPILLSLAGVVLLACGGSAGVVPIPGPPAPPGQPFGLDVRTPLAALAFPLDNPAPSAVDLEPAFSNLSFTRPVYLTAAPDGTDWIYVVEQGGRIHVFPNDDSVPTANTFLDLSAGAGGPVSRASDEEGLLGLAFDPDYAANGRFYVHYSASGPRRSVIARYTATFPPGAAPSASPATFLEILSVPQPEPNHNAGMLEFGPDGHLYVGFGDGGSGGDPHGAIGNGQDLGTLLGSMLRIDVRNSTAVQRYAIPADNPFVAVAGARDEIWAYGLRNPWRFSFDRNTGELLLGDVGQGAREEIDLLRTGGNYGWRIYEGDAPFNNPQGLPPSSFSGPVIDYARTLGTSITGGYVYRGQDVPSLRGVYVYGDYGSGRIWGLTHADGALVGNAQIQSLSQVCSFGEDERGELYALSLGGAIRRFREPSGGGTPPPFPGLLSQTGLFTSLATLTPTAGLLEYGVNAALWSDDAAKRRWIGVPGADRITFRPEQPWDLPVGTVLVKHFELELEVGNPASTRRLETRVLVHEQQGWSGYTYRWTDAQTDAVLLQGALGETFTILDAAAPGGQREQTWVYPSRTDCLQCHTAPAGRVIGVRTGQLNGDFVFPNATDNQLRTWNHIGLFTTDIGDAAGYVAWPDPAGPAGTVESRARAYLAANCAQCHLAGGTAPDNLDFRYVTPTSGMGAVGVPPVQGNLGLPAPFVVAAGAKENSVLWLRMQTLDGTRMPRLGSARVHGAGVDRIGRWIDALP